MTQRSGSGDERSMGEILASIRRIVSDEERARKEAPAGGAGDVLELTPAMRAAGASPGEVPGYGSSDGDGGDGLLDLGSAGRTLPSPPSPDFPPAVEAWPRADEIEEIVRRVLREELQGPVGLEISRKVKASIRDEVRRVLDEDEPLI